VTPCGMASRTRSRSLSATRAQHGTGGRKEGKGRGGGVFGSGKRVEDAPKDLWGDEIRWAVLRKEAV